MIVWMRKHNAGLSYSLTTHGNICPLVFVQEMFFTLGAAFLGFGSGLGGAGFCRRSKQLHFLSIRIDTDLTIIH